jgi:hypothetical protein
VNRVIIHFSTIEYELSHGKKPRGCGLWIFATKRDGSGTRFVSTNPYTLAKADVRIQASNRFALDGLTVEATLYVQP